MIWGVFRMQDQLENIPTQLDHLETKDGHHLQLKPIINTF